MYFIMVKYEHTHNCLYIKKNMDKHLPVERGFIQARERTGGPCNLYLSELF